MEFRPPVCCNDDEDDDAVGDVHQSRSGATGTEPTQAPTGARGTARALAHFAKMSSSASAIDKT